MKRAAWLTALLSLGGCIDFDRAYQNCLDGGWCDPRVDSGSAGGTAGGGAGGTGGGAAGGVDGGGAVVVVPDAGQANRIAVGAEGLYWVDRKVAGAGSLWLLRRDGGTTRIASGQCEPNDLVLSPHGLFWANAANAAAPCVGGISMDPLDGGQAARLWPPTLPDGGLDDGGRPTSLAVDSSGTVYWTEFIAGAVVWRHPDGGSGSLLGYPKATGVATDSESFYWTTTIDDGGVFQRSLDGGGPTASIAAGQNEPARIVIFDGGIYWANRDMLSGAIVALPVSGGPLQQLATSQTSPDGIAVDATGVYWVNSDAPFCVHRVRLDGSGLLTLSCHGAGAAPSGIALDATHVYWSIRTGPIYRQLKPP